MALKNDFVRIYGGNDSAVYKAPLATAPPTDLSKPIAPWADAGWLGEDGVTEEQKIKRDDIRGHQGGRIVRTVFTEFERNFSFVCMEENAISFGWLYPGTTFTKTGTGAAAIAKGTLSDSPSINAEAYVIDEFEVEKNAAGIFVQKRFIISKGRIDPSTKITHKFGEVTLYEYTLTPEGPVDMITNSPGLLV